MSTTEPPVAPRNKYEPTQTNGIKTGYKTIAARAARLIRGFYILPCPLL